MKQIVLVGPGHTHVYVLARWRREPLPGVQLTCVSPFSMATYSGMLPGVLAGKLERSAMEIDLARLCAAAGARLVVASASSLDVGGGRVLLDGGEALAYDVLSIGVGSVPSTDGVRVGPGAAVVPMKPMQTFLERLTAAIARRGVGLARPLRLAIVGGGAAGVELALCAPKFIARVSGRSDTRCVLVTEGRLLEGSAHATVVRAAKALQQRGVTVRESCRVTGAASSSLSLDDGTSVPVDVAIWVTAATAPPLLAATGLPVDDRGFLRTNAALQSIASDRVFAVGDAGSVDGVRVPKAGVHAVRQGPTLWANLRRALEHRPLEAYVPQHSFLKLLNTGDGSAIGEWRSWSFEGRLAAHLKRWIDQRFVAQYRC